MLGIKNDYAAFCLDEVVVLYGESLEAELDKVAENAKTTKVAESRQKLVLQKWLGIKEQEGGQKTFATPTPTR